MTIHEDQSFERYMPRPKERAYIIWDGQHPMDLFVRGQYHITIF